MTSTEAAAYWQSLYLVVLFSTQPERCCKYLSQKALGWAAWATGVGRFQQDSGCAPCLMLRLGLPWALRNSPCSTQGCRPHPHPRLPGATALASTLGLATAWPGATTDSSWPWAAGPLHGGKEGTEKKGISGVASFPEVPQGTSGALPFGTSAEDWQTLPSAGHWL